MKAWTDAEDKRLLLMCGSHPADRIVEALPGRTLTSVRHRANRLGVQLGQGSWTLMGLCKETGYDWRHLQRARKALRQQWDRSAIRKTTRGDGKGGTRFLISDDQAQALLNWLGAETHPPKRWAIGLDRCIKCRRNDRKHIGLGLCTSCGQKRKYGERCKDCGAWPWTMKRLLNVSAGRRRNAGRRRRPAPHGTLDLKRKPRSDK